MSERAGPGHGPDDEAATDEGRWRLELDPENLLEQAKADRRRRLTSTATLAVVGLVIVTFAVASIAIAGLGNPPIGLVIALGLCWLVVVSRPPSIGWRP